MEKADEVSYNNAKNSSISEVGGFLLIFAVNPNDATTDFCVFRQNFF